MSNISVSGGSNVEELRERIAACRRGRYPSAPLPRELWRELAQCAGRLGVYRASRALGVSYESLRMHMQGGAAQRPEVSFVEFAGSQVLGGSHGAVVEVAERGGGRLSIRLAAGEHVDVAAVVSAFAGGQPCCK